MITDTHRVTLLGIPLHALGMQETVDRVAEIVATKQPRQLVVVNSATYVLIWRDPRLADIVAHCEIVSPDGQSVVWASRLLRRRVPERVAGPDLFLKLIAESAQRGWRCYFLGGEAVVVEEAVQRLRAGFAELQVAGFRDGYWDCDEEVVAHVRRAQPDLLFLALPSPKKELWLSQNLERLGVPLVMGVGGVFDIVAGKTTRAPVWAQRAGLEWTYRLLQEPRRLFRRYLTSNTVFVYGVLRALLTARPERNPLGPRRVSPRGSMSAFHTD